MGDLEDETEKTELNGIVGNDTSKISAYDHVTRSEEVIEKQLSDVLEVVQQKLRTKHNELLKICSSDQLSLSPESCNKSESVSNYIFQNVTKNNFPSVSDQTCHFEVDKKLQIPEVYAQSHDETQLESFNAGDFFSTSQPTTSNRNNNLQISSSDETISESESKLIIISFQHLIDRPGSLASKTKHLQWIMSAISLTELGIICSRDFQVYQGIQLLRDFTFVESITLTTIRNHLRSVILRKLFERNTICKSNALSDDWFDSVIRDFSSSQLHNIVHYPYYLHTIGITVYNLLLHLTKYVNLSQQIAKSVWYSDCYNSKNKQDSVVYDQLSVSSSLSSESLHQSDSVLSREMLQNKSLNSPKNVRSTQRLHYRTASESEFSEKDENVNTSLSELFYKSTLVIASENRLNLDISEGPPFEKPLLEECIPSDFSLSDITDFTDIPLETDSIEDKKYQ